MTPRYCSQCGAPAELSARVCPKCGAALPGGGARSDPGPSKATGQRPSGAIRDSLVVVGVVVVVAALFFALKERTQPPQPEISAPANPAHGNDLPMDLLDSLPNDYGTLVSMGNKFMDEQSYAVAAEIYRRALEIDGRSPDVRTDYGACLHGMGLPNRAIEEFRKVLTASPEHAIARFNLGIVFRGEGSLDSARHYFEGYLALDPDGAPADAARQYLKELGG